MKLTVFASNSCGRLTTEALLVIVSRETEKTLVYATDAEHKQENEKATAAIEDFFLQCRLCHF